MAFGHPCHANLEEPAEKAKGQVEVLPYHQRGQDKATDAWGKDTHGIVSRSATIQNV